MFPRYATGEVGHEIKSQGFLLRSELRVRPKFISDLHTYHPEDQLSSLDRPVLFVHGTSDPRLDHMKTVRATESLSGAALALISGANHS